MPVSALAAKHSLSRRVFGTVFSVAFIGIAVFAIAGTVFLHANLARSTKNELYDEVEIVATALNSAEDDVAMLKNMKFDSKRVTLIDVGGDVIYDSEESESVYSASRIVLAGICHEDAGAAEAGEESGSKHADVPHPVDIDPCRGNR